MTVLPSMVKGTGDGGERREAQRGTKKKTEATRCGGWVDWRGRKFRGGMKWKRDVLDESKLCWTARFRYNGNGGGLELEGTEIATLVYFFLFHRREVYSMKPCLGRERAAPLGATCHDKPRVSILSVFLETACTRSMPHIPVIGRLSLKEYVALLVGISILVVETLLRFIVLLLPKPVVAWFYNRSQVLFDRFSSTRGTATTEETFASTIRTAKDFGELAALYGYAHEEHVVLTKDGYVLTLHRIPRRKGEDSIRQPDADVKKPAVYLHHGLLMNSEVWICLTDETRCLPFVLAEQGMCGRTCMMSIDLACVLCAIRRL